MPDHTSATNRPDAVTLPSKTRALTCVWILVVAIVVCGCLKFSPGGEGQEHEANSNGSTGSKQETGYSDPKERSGLLSSIKALMARAPLDANDVAAAEGLLKRAVKQEDRTLLKRIAENAEKTLLYAARNMDLPIKTRRTAYICMGYLAPVSTGVHGGLLNELHDEGPPGWRFRGCVLQVAKLPGADALFRETVVDPNSDAKLRRQAAMYLGYIGKADNETVNALLSALDSERESVVGRAGEALGKIALAHDGNSLPEQRIAKVLVRELKKTRNSATWARLLVALGDLGPEAACAVKEIHRQRRKVGEIMETSYALAMICPKDPQGVDELASLVRKGTSREAYWSADLLGRMGPRAKRALPVLEKRLRREKPGSHVIPKLQDVIRRIKDDKKGGKEKEQKTGKKGIKARKGAN
jgi:hypothetical protein